MTPKLLFFPRSLLQILSHTRLCCLLSACPHGDLGATAGWGKVALSWPVVCLSEVGLRPGAGSQQIVEKRGPRAGMCQTVGRVTELGSSQASWPHLPPPGRPFSGTKCLCDCLPARWWDPPRQAQDLSILSLSLHQHRPYFFTPFHLPLLVY